MNPGLRKILAVPMGCLLIAGVVLMAQGKWDTALKLAEIASPVTIVITVLVFAA
ncbi:hypothetical protein [Paraburkholderia fungorum]|uniref:hypothetical protein n=1 Tax=Paraburkholderia fungorum TaxID=134537 RepID=UPI000ADFE233|nr:hypothetical protein [Paraburkholderia fungorum]